MSQSKTISLLGFAALALAQTAAPPSGGVGDHDSNGLLRLSISHPQPTATELRDRAHLPPQWYGGVLAFTLTNVSRDEDATVTSGAGFAEFEVEVFDVGGNPVPMTAAGKRMQAARHTHLTVLFGTHATVLHPGHQVTSTFDLSRFFEIQPGAIYTVKASRSWGLPTHDRSGKKIDAELSGSYVITGHEDQ